MGKVGGGRIGTLMTLPLIQFVKFNFVSEYFNPVIYEVNEPMVSESIRIPPTKNK